MIEQLSPTTMVLQDFDVMDDPETPRSSELRLQRYDAAPRGTISLTIQDPGTGLGDDDPKARCVYLRFAQLETALEVLRETDPRYAEGASPDAPTSTDLRVVE